MNKGFDKTGYCFGMVAHSIGSMKSPFRFRRASNLFAPSRRDLSRLDLEMVYPDEMAVILQHRKEEQAIRERQLNSGATRLTHIRPARAKASEVGSLARFRSGYRKNSFFGPFCEIISSRLISNISELSDVETTYLAPEFKSVERLRSRDWARATKIEVLVLQTIPDDKP